MTAQVLFGDARLPARFWSKVRVEDSGCWCWTARIDECFYGRFGWQRKNRYAHRIAYEQTVGPVPLGYEIDHLCRVRHCVNPAHMEVVTHRENMHRSETPAMIVHRSGRCSACGDAADQRRDGKCLACHRARHREYVRQRYGYVPREEFEAKFRARTHCIHGHEFTPENTYVRSNGGKTCKTCRKRDELRSRQGRKARHH